MRTIDLNYKFDEVRYAPFGRFKSAYALNHTYECQVSMEDIVEFYFEPCEKEFRESVLKTLHNMERFDLINWDTLETDNDFIDFLTDKYEYKAREQLVEELEESEREGY
jgi:hypothetical protein